MSAAQTNSSTRLKHLKERSRCLQMLRSYFCANNVLEVDCPSLTRYAPVDEHIDLIKTEDGRYLSSSPEYLMKRLLCEGMGDIYQLSRVYRAKEAGNRHNPEFTLLEWYRVGFSLEQMIEDTLRCLAVILGEKAVEALCYQEIFLSALSLDPLDCSKNELLQKIEEQNIADKKELAKEPKDTLLQLLFSYLIEPKLGQNCFFVVYDFPASQAALAKIEGRVAKRFEIFYQGVELANGYDEEKCADTLQKRFEEANNKRRSAQKEAYPLDTLFLDELKNTPLPSCCGVAVGFDRLLMLRQGVSSIEQILPFSWNSC